VSAGIDGLTPCDLDPSVGKTWNQDGLGIGRVLGLNYQFVIGFVVESRITGEDTARTMMAFSVPKTEPKMRFKALLEPELQIMGRTSEWNGVLSQATGLGLCVFNEIQIAKVLRGRCRLLRYVSHGLVASARHQIGHLTVV
jgi:hypothetical protein